MTRTIPAPAAVFSRLGLRSESLVSGPRLQTEVLAVRLRQALEELGGLYVAYGAFLQWRSDLLTSGELEAFGSLDVAITGRTREQVAALLSAELGDAGRQLAATLGSSPAWTTLTRTAWPAQLQDRPVIVQVANLPVDEASVLAFRSGVQALGSPQLVGLQNPAVLKEFVEWARTSETLETERAFLDAIRQYGGETAAVYPVPIPELCSPSVLTWDEVTGTPVAELLRKGDPNVCGLIARAVLEQFCALAMVEGDLQPEAMVVTPAGKLGFRRLTRPVATPPGLGAAALEYAAAAIAGDASLSSRTLLRLAISYESPQLEKELISQLSAVEPELKVHRWFPPSAETFEANWRALAKLPVERSLFLDCFHRNLIAIAYWQGDTVRLGAPMTDLIAAAQWPVVNHILQSRVKGLMNSDDIAQWAASSGLLMLGVMKETSRIAGEIRDNRLSMGFDLTTATASGTVNTRPAWLLPLGLLLLTVFLVCLRWGALAPASMIIPVRALTIAAGVGLFWVVLRIR